MRFWMPIFCAIVAVGSGCVGSSGSRPAAGGSGAPTGEALVASEAVAAFEARLARLEQRQAAIEQLVRGIDATLAAQFAALAQETRMIREQLDAQDRWIGSLARSATADPFASGAADPTSGFDVVDLDSTRAPVWSPAADPVSRWSADAPLIEAARDSVAALAAQSSPGSGDLVEGGNDWPAERRPQDPPEEGIRLYEVAYEDLKRGNYQLALINLRAFLDRYPATNLADNAQYWVGEAYYAQGQFEIAIEEFRQVIDEHPGEDKEPAAYYKIALAFEALDDPDTARRYLEFLVERFPQTREARLARERLDRF